MTYLQKRCSSCETGSCSRNLPSQTRGGCTTASSKNCELVMRNSKCWKKISHHCLLFSSPPPRDATLHFRKSNGVVNHEFAEVYTVRAGSPFSALHGGVVVRFLLWKFRPPYTRADSENCSAGLYICLHEKKERKWKKSLWRRQGGGKWWSNIKLHGEKETN